jgi:tetratricopeptide (TPR) repeat protein
VTWNNKGVIFAQNNLFKEALYCFNRSIDSNNFYAPPWNNKGVILAKVERYEEALHAVNNAAILRNNYTKGLTGYKMSKFQPV